MIISKTKAFQRILLLLIYISFNLFYYQVEISTSDHVNSKTNE